MAGLAFPAIAGLKEDDKNENSREDTRREFVVLCGMKWCVALEEREEELQVGYISLHHYDLILSEFTGSGQ